jgi:hypothetical protein
MLNDWTPAHQQRFVRSLCNSIRDELIQKIKDKKVPMEWNGHELRELLAEKFNFERTSTMQEKRSKRVKDYHNTRIVNNL